MSRQSDILQSLDVVLKEQVKAGRTVIQGRHHSRSLKSILEKNSDAAPFFIDLQDRKEVIEYRKEDQVISVETGMLLSELSALLSENKQFLPCFAARDLSLLEVINSGETGYFEHSYGLRALVLGLEVILSSGVTIKTGGKVVKNVTGYDLTKLFIGARGTLGVPTKAHLRVFAQPEQNEVFIVSGVSFDGLMLLANNLMKTGLPLTGMELVVGSKLKLASDFLLIAVGEHSNVVSELVPLIEDHSRKVNAQIARLAEDEHGEIMRSLEDEFDLDPSLLALSLSRSQCQKAYSALRATIKFKMHFRPGTGKLRLRLNSTGELIAVRNILHKTLGGSDSGIDISTSSEQFEIMTEPLNGLDDELERIKRSVKEKFDPSGKMNPFAKL